MKKEVQIYIEEVLRLITELIPLKPGQNHSFQLGGDGRLWLWLLIGDTFQSIIFDDNYEDITPAQLVEGIKQDLIKGGYKL